MRICIFMFLLIGLFLLFYRVSALKIPKLLLKRTKQSMEAAERQRLLANRINLQKFKEEHSFWFRMERELYYSGILRRFPHLTVEKWLVWKFGVFSVVFYVFDVVVGLGGAICVCGALGILEWLCLFVGKARMLRAVDRNLLKFLDFLGNYSITSGEVTGVFNQISRYLEEPLKSALDECYLEARTTGDVGLALLAMAEKIEHPKFKELVQNIEISTRYCADFKNLVTASRRSVREHLRMGEERKGMLREAVINMILLLMMSVVILVAVEGLLGVRAGTLLLYSMPGKIALSVIAVILFLFGRQIGKSFG